MKSLTIILRDFQPLTKTKPIPQHNVLEYTSWLLAAAECAKNKVNSEEEANRIYHQKRIEVERYGVSPRYISKRELNAFADVYSHEEKLFNSEYFPLIYENILTDINGKDIAYRLSLYEDLTLDLMQKWYEEMTVFPDDVIHATCTGYLSPSPIQKLLSRKGLEDITVTHSYQMGCYGAIPPLRMAIGFLASSYTTLSKHKKSVDILHTEYSSLHIQAINSSPDQIVSMSLFGDGFIKYTVCIEDDRAKYEAGLKVLATQDKILSASLNEMSLIPGPYSFDMWLSKNVPLKIRDEIHGFVTSLCKQVNFNFDEIKDELIFALHPGGPKIIEHIQERLELSEEQVRFSKKILYEHGNMVSATLPYILKEIIEDPGVAPGTKILSIAFGPGITIAGFILEKT